MRKRKRRYRKVWARRTPEEETVWRGRGEEEEKRKKNEGNKKRVNCSWAGTMTENELNQEKCKIPEIKNKINKIIDKSNNFFCSEIGINLGDQTNGGGAGHSGR